MLAARDQENLVHGHQAAAAAKPLNQGLGQLLPKTPGNKVPKTPFKVPLNDENILGGLGGGKTGLKTVGTAYIMLRRLLSLDIVLTFITINRT